MVTLDAETRRLLLEEIAREVDPAFFETWCRTLDFVRDEDGLFQVPCGSRYCRDLLEPKLGGPLRRAVVKLFGGEPRIVFRVDERASPLTIPEPAPPIPPPAPRAPRPEPALPGIPLRDEYTFDTLIEGPTNRFAIAAGMQVANQPFEHPMFLYGKSGVGKTHLLHAICHRVRATHPHLRAVYIPCEAFISEFLNAIKVNRTEEFRGRYKSIDFLVIDDIDQLAHKEATQSEFFHIFNHLALHRRQMILSCDTPPRSIHTLKERLSSRFESGLVVSIDPPQFEMRMAIVKSKGERKGREIPDDVCRLIAEHFTENVREIEGAVIKAVALAHLTGRPIDLEVAREALKDKLEPRPRALACDDVISIVAGDYRLSPADLRRHTRKPRVVEAKQVCLYLCHLALKLSTRELAAALGLSSHNSAAVAVRKVRSSIERNPALRETVDRLRAQVERFGKSG
jgi:chromosomal replication initiator protein